jgi:hypothetical protein
MSPDDAHRRMVRETLGVALAASRDLWLFLGILARTTGQEDAWKPTLDHAQAVARELKRQADVVRLTDAEIPRMLTWKERHGVRR